MMFVLSRRVRIRHEASRTRHFLLDIPAMALAFIQIETFAASSRSHNWPSAIFNQRPCFEAFLPGFGDQIDQGLPVVERGFSREPDTSVRVTEMRIGKGSTAYILQ